MNRLQASIPRASDFRQFIAEPLDFLVRARASLGNVFVVRDEGPVFSRASDCKGVVAVFGAENQRAVLTDIKSFGMPASAAKQMGLSENLINLNRSLHSMSGDQHAAHKRLLLNIFSDSCVRVYHKQVHAALVDLVKGWRTGETVGLLGQMRELALRASSRVLFGDAYARSSQLVLLLQTYFHLRREASSPVNWSDEIRQEQLVAVLEFAENTALR